MNICRCCNGVQKEEMAAMVIFVIDIFALLHLKLNVAYSLLISFLKCLSFSWTIVANISINNWALLASGGLLLSDYLLNVPEDKDKYLEETKEYLGGSWILMMVSLLGVHLTVLYCNLGDWLLLALLLISTVIFIFKIYIKKRIESKKNSKDEFIAQVGKGLLEVIRLLGGFEYDMQELKEEVEQLTKVQREQKKPLAEIKSTVAVSKLKILDLATEVENTQAEVKSGLKDVKSEIQDLKTIMREIKKKLNQPLKGKSRKNDGCSRLECCHCSRVPPSFAFQCNIGHLLCQPCLPLLSGACPLCHASLPDPPCRNLLAEACIQAMNEVD